MYGNYGANMFVRDSALRLTARCGFQNTEMVPRGADSIKKSADGRPLAWYWVANPLPVLGQ